MLILCFPYHSPFLSFIVVTVAVTVAVAIAIAIAVVVVIVIVHLRCCLYQLILC